jgi:multidrug efflux pump subunit AcrB
LLVDRRKASMLGVSQQAIVSTLRAGLAGDATTYLHDESKYPAAAVVQLPADRQGELDALLQLGVRGAAGQIVPIRELVTVSDTQREQPAHHKDLLPVDYVVGDMAGASTARSTACSACARGWPTSPPRAAGASASISSASLRRLPRLRDQVGRRMAGHVRDLPRHGRGVRHRLVLIYLLVVAQFGSYLTPLVIMAPIPLTIVGVMPGHALLARRSPRPA